MTNTCSIKLFFATGNIHKLNEVKPIAERYGICLEQMIESRAKVEIQSSDLIEIARYAVLENYKLFKKPVLVEDAGLFIEALNGFPGPYSSYVYKTIGVNGILKLMEGVDNRRAYFMSVAAIVYEPFFIIETARVEGVITKEPRGSGGFGFDPIFVPRGSKKTFAEMSIDEKNMYSHRAKAVSKAFSKLVHLLKTYNTR